MEAIPPLVVPIWIAGIVLLVISAVIIKAAKPDPEPRGLPSFLLSFAIPVAVTSLIALLVSGIGSLLLAVRAIVDTGATIAHSEHVELTPGAGAAIAVALVLSLVVLIGSAVLASRPGEAGHRH